MWVDWMERFEARVDWREDISRREDSAALVGC